MMKISLDEDSNETTSYSPTPHGEDSESMLEEKSLSALAGQVTRQPVEDASEKTEKGEKDGEKSKEEEQVGEEKSEEKEEKESVVVATAETVVEASPVVSAEVPQVEEVKDDEKKEKKEEGKEDVESKAKESENEKENEKPVQPDVEQLTEQYKQLQKDFAELQHRLMMNSNSAQMNPAMAYQANQMQQQMQQHIMMQQQQMLFQQQQQQTMMAPQHGGYVVVPQPGGGVIMSPPQMMYHPMAVPQVPVYGQMPAPVGVSAPSAEQAASIPVAKPGTDEADSSTKDEVKDTSKVTKPVENAQEETPVKPATEASTAPSGRRNVFADILKKKNSSKVAYVVSAAREAQRQRSDSNPSITSPTSKSPPSVRTDTSKSETRTAVSASVASPNTQGSSVSIVNGLSPTSSTTTNLPPLKVITTPTSPSSLAAISPSSDSSPSESNNNLSKTTSPGVKEPTTKTGSDPTSLPAKVPPAIRPKPRQGPRPFRPASMYARTPTEETEGEGSKFSTHARKVADLRSVSMISHNLVPQSPAHIQPSPLSPLFFKIPSFIQKWSSVL